MPDQFADLDPARLEKLLAILKKRPDIASALESADLAQMMAVLMEEKGIELSLEHRINRIGKHPTLAAIASALGKDAEPRHSPLTKWLLEKEVEWSACVPDHEDVSLADFVAKTLVIDAHEILMRVGWDVAERNRGTSSHRPLDLNRCVGRSFASELQSLLYSFREGLPLYCLDSGQLTRIENCAGGAYVVGLAEHGDFPNDYFDVPKWAESTFVRPKERQIYGYFWYDNSSTDDPLYQLAHDHKRAAVRAAIEGRLFLTADPSGSSHVQRLDTREKASMRMLVRALCVGAAIDPDASNAVSQVTALLEIKGVTMDPKTIRKYLTRE